MIIFKIMKVCRYCSAEFEDYEYNEFLKHENDCVKVCKFCDQHFPTFDETSIEKFNKHTEQCEIDFMATITKEEVKKCNNEKEKEEEILDEGSIHSGLAWKCGRCDKIVYKKKMKEHYEKEHNKWICHLCKKEILKTEMKEHLIKCKEENIKKKIQCDICDKYVAKTSIYAHFQKMHKTKYTKNKEQPEEKQLKKIKCYICKKMYNPVAIYAHMRNIHKEVYVAETGHKPGKKPGKKAKLKQCTICGEKIANLKQHMIKTHGIKTAGHSGREQKGNLFFVTVQQPIKRFLMNMLTRPSMSAKGYCVRVHFRKKKTHTLIHTVRHSHGKTRFDKFTYTNLTGKFQINMLDHNGIPDSSKLSNVTWKKHYPKYPPYLKQIKKPLIKEGVAGNEWGLLEEHGHCHFYFKFHKKVLIKDLSKFIRRRCRFLGDIEPGRQAERQIKYCSKEDLKAITYNLDKERLHNNWQMAQVAFNATSYRDGVRTWSYQQMKWGTDFNLKKFKRVFDAITSNQAMQKAAKEAGNYVNQGILRFLSPSKKGIWLHGSPGIGKTSTVFHYTKGQHYHMPKEINRFCFTAWDKPNNIIVFEDVQKDEMIKHSRMINELTDDRGMTVGERKGNDHFMVVAKKCIITSNDPPPTELEWGQGFDRRFDVIDGDALDGTMYQHLQ